MKDTFFIYHFNAATKKISLLEKVKVEHGFISGKYLRSCLFAFSEEYFKEHETEDPENELYILDEYGNKPAGHFKKKYFSPEADEEPFDSDIEPDVDWNGEWN